MVQEARRARVQLRKTAARAFSSLLSARNRTFELWHSNVAAERQMRIVAGRVVTAMLMRSLIAALHRWAEVRPLSALLFAGRRYVPFQIFGSVLTQAPGSAKKKLQCTGLSQFLDCCP